MRSASAKVGAPTGITMNSWKSIGLSACAPPLTMFIIGTGSMRADGAADIAVERQVVGDRRGLRDRKRHAEDRVGAEPGFVGRAVERDHGLVDLGLAFGVHAADGVENLAFDRVDRLAHALAEIAGLVAVAQFDRLMRAGRGARRHRGAAERAVRQHDLDFHGRIAAAVEDFAGENVGDGGHVWKVPEVLKACRFYRIVNALVMSRESGASKVRKNVQRDVVRA